MGLFRSRMLFFFFFVFFFQAEDGIRDYDVTGVQTCALPIFLLNRRQGNHTFDIEIVSSFRFVVALCLSNLEVGDRKSVV